MILRLIPAVGACAALMTCPAFAAEPALLAPAEYSPLKVPANTVAAADVNRDGIADLLLPAGRELHVMTGNGSGFAAARYSPIKLAEAASEIAIADVNGDKRNDIVLAGHDTYAVTVLLDDAVGAFVPAEGSPFPARTGRKPHTHGLALADFNRDGHFDIATCNQDDRDVSLLLGDGRGTFTVAPASPFPCGPGPYPIDAADLDADGAVDLLVPNSVPGRRTLTILKGDGAGNFASPAEVATAGAAFFVATGDLNDDGAPDAAVTHNDDDRATVLLNDGGGGLRPAPASPLALGHNCWGVAVRDMNGDGHGDLVTAGGDHVRVVLGDSRGGFAAATGSPYPTGKGTWRFATADFNGDGKLDVAAAIVEAKHVAVLLGR